MEPGQHTLDYTTEENGNSLLPLQLIVNSLFGKQGASGDSSPIRDEVIKSPVLCGSYAENHSSSEFTSAPATPCLGGIIFSTTNAWTSFPLLSCDVL